MPRAKRCASTRTNNEILLDTSIPPTNKSSEPASKRRKDVLIEDVSPLSSNTRMTRGRSKKDQEKASSGTVFLLNDCRKSATTMTPHISVINPSLTPLHTNTLENNIITPEVKF